MKRTIHIGTSGWSYKHWRDRFYPTSLPATEYLSYYAQFFDTVEINTSFYHLPKIETVAHWTEMVPEGFYFCPKMSRYVTHMKKLHDPGETLERFFEVFQPMRGSTGPVLVQLPPSLGFHESLAADFFSVLQRDYPDQHYALEVRHDSWTKAEALELLQRFHVPLVISQSGVGFPYMEITSAKDIYIRFHGPGALYASCYTDEELRVFADKALEWMEGGHSVWFFFNNDINGYAITDALRLKDMLA
ncbi:MAG: DUF72 domain-containing protein [Bacteroidetes bacterium]|nr:DUF72 domain-containing protein [Bacteroidota bacterium]